MTRPDFIAITTRVGSKTGEPAIELRWGHEAGELTVTQARVHALKILEAAESCEQDAFIVAWGKRHGLDDNGAAVLLKDFRQARDLRTETENHP